MSRRTQRLDILTAAGLAESERDRELRQGQREAANTSRWAGALSSLIPAGISAAGAVYDGLGEQAVDEATALAASKSDVVDQQEANDIVAANFKEPEAPGILDNLMKPVRAKARATATTALSSSAKANTATRDAKAAGDAKAALEQKRFDEAKADRDLQRTREEAHADWENQKDIDKMASDAAFKEREVKVKERPKPGKPPPSPEAVERQRVKDELAKAQLAALQGKSAPPDNLAPTTTTLSSLQKTRTDRLGVRQSLARVRQLVGDPAIRAEIGKAASLEDAVLRLSGSSNEKFRRVATPLQQFINAYKTQVTGAAASDKELETQILPAVPTMADSPADFFVKLEENERGLSDLVAGIDAILRKNDVTAGDGVGGNASSAPSFDDF